MFCSRHPPLHFDFCAFSPLPFCSHVGNWNSITQIFWKLLQRKFRTFCSHLESFRIFDWIEDTQDFWKLLKVENSLKVVVGFDLEKISGSWDCWKKMNTFICSSLRHNFFAQYGSHKIQVLPISSSNVYDFHKNIDTKLWPSSYNWSEFHFNTIKGRLVKSWFKYGPEKSPTVSYICLEYLI